MLVLLARATIRTITFQQGPQDFPFGRDVTRSVIPIAVLTNYLQLRLTLPPLMSAAQALVSVLALGAAVIVLLNMRKLTERAAQTCNAVFSVNAVFTLMMLPLVHALAPILLAAAANPEGVVSAQIPAHLRFGVIALSMWNLAVIGHILRHALNIGMGLGIGLAFCCAMFVVVTVGTFGALFV